MIGLDGAPALGAPSPVDWGGGITPGRLWWADLDQPAEVAERLIGLCTPVERARAGRLCRAGQRRDRLVGRGLLRTVLGAHLARPPEAVAIVLGGAGKPRMADGSSLGFSVSHSFRQVAVVVHPTRHVGIDVEFAGRALDVDLLTRTVLSPADRSRVEAAGADRRDEFLRVWTAREAALKAGGLGLGLRAGPAVGPGARGSTTGGPMGAAPGPGGPSTNRIRLTLAEPADDVVVTAAAAPPGYLAAVAVGPAVDPHDR